MRQKSGTATKKMVCNNCFRPLIGIKNEAGVVRVCCPFCGAVTMASKKKPKGGANGIGCARMSGSTMVK